MNKEAEIEFMVNSDNWPCFPVLPIVNREYPKENGLSGAGILVADNGPIVYKLNMFTLQSGSLDWQLQEAEKVTFASFDELYDAGWRVD